MPQGSGHRGARSNRMEVEMKALIIFILLLIPQSGGAADRWVLREETSKMLPKLAKERPGIVSLHDTKVVWVKASKVHATEWLERRRAVEPRNVWALKNGQGHTALFQQDERMDFFTAQCWPAGVTPQ